MLTLFQDKINDHDVSCLFDFLHVQYTHNIHRNAGFSFSYEYMKSLRSLHSVKKTFLNFFLLQVIFSKYTDLLPKEVLNEDTPELQKPDEDAVKEVSHAVVCMQGRKTQVFIKSSCQNTSDLTTKGSWVSQFPYLIISFFLLLAQISGFLGEPSCRTSQTYRKPPASLWSTC